jgi:HAD superfamily hydrolase (TIGR01548 family)
VLAPEAILLDMDGVIADEGPSYREVIRQMLTEKGLQISREDIAAAKARGRANNDWELTAQILSEGGVEVSLEQVIRRFQEIYLGSDGQRGLCEKERLIPAAEFLRNLSDRYQLAIVTGRPRADAEAFLRRFDLKDLFGAVVCMEDAPAKPDPSPVKLALEKLGLDRAWMLGDTPDDVQAARSAGVLPLGVRPPCSEDDVGDALDRSGAAVTLDRTDQIEELLP